MALSPTKPLRVPHIFAVAAIPRGFDIVADVQPTPAGIVIIAQNGKTATMPLDTAFLQNAVSL